MWENYLEDEYKPRAMRIKVDDDGYEYLEIDQKPSVRTRKGSLGTIGAMGDEDLRASPDRRSRRRRPAGPKGRESASLFARVDLIGGTFRDPLRCREEAKPLVRERTLSAADLGTSFCFCFSSD